MVRYSRVSAALTSVFVVALSGCATKVSDTYTYRPPDSDSSAWAISGRVEEGALEDQLVILIDGTEVTGGTLNEFKQKGNFTGSYKGRTVLAECELTDPPAGEIAYGHECEVFVDNERATALDF